MCCFVEIAMTIWGIVTLATGKFTLAKNKIVTGGPAYSVGVILTATFPVAFGLGLVVGFVIVAQGGNPQEDMLKYAWIDAVVVLALLGLAFAVAIPNAKDPNQQLGAPGQPWNTGPTSFPPADPNNPYQSPHTNPQNPFGDQPAGGQQPGGGQWPPKSS